jgi:phenylpropionate dioxygenase-like ring-hydroxylating dioxygenase large terminal subunit
MLKNFWYALCLSTEAKEKPIRVTALGQDLVVYRNSKHKAIAMSDLCVHRGGALSSGCVKHGNISPMALV